MSLVPDFCARRCWGWAGAEIRLAELRGNVDSRLRRLHESRGARHLDGIVLAFAGLARLWADEAGRGLLEQLFAPLPRMVLPLSNCPTRPRRGARHRVPCRDDATARLLAEIDMPDPPRHRGRTSPARRARRAVISASVRRGSRCRIWHAALCARGRSGSTAALDARHASGGTVGPVRAWDGSRAERAAIEAVPKVSPPARAVFRPAKRFSLRTPARCQCRHGGDPPGCRIYVPGVRPGRRSHSRACGSRLRGRIGIRTTRIAVARALAAASAPCGLDRAHARGGRGRLGSRAGHRHLSSPGRPVRAGGGAAPPGHDALLLDSSAQFDRCIVR